MASNSLVLPHAYWNYFCFLYRGQSRTFHCDVHFRFAGKNMHGVYFVGYNAAGGAAGCRALTAVEWVHGSNPQQSTQRQSAILPAVVDNHDWQCAFIGSCAPPWRPYFRQPCHRGAVAYVVPRTYKSWFPWLSPLASELRLASKKHRSQRVHLVQ